MCDTAFVSMAELSSPNTSEVSFLNSSDKKDEYMMHLRTLTFPTDAVVLDIGANVGAFSKSVANYLGSEARVFAFEPFQAPFEHLSKNVAGLPVECIKNGVGTQEGTLKGTYLPNYTLLSGFHVDGKDKEMLEQLAGKSLDVEFAGAEEEVECTRLDSFMAARGLDKVDILKIDVEKAELDVLLSLGDRLADVGCVVAEVHQVNLERFVEVLQSRFSTVQVGEKDLPKFCLGHTPEAWPEELNTHIVFAK